MASKLKQTTSRQSKRKVTALYLYTHAPHAWRSFQAARDEGTLPEGLTQYETELHADAAYAWLARSNGNSRIFETVDQGNDWIKSEGMAAGSSLSLVRVH